MFALARRLQAPLSCLVIFSAVASSTFAAQVAFYSNRDESILAPTGHTVSAVSLTAIELGALPIFDVLVIGHVTPTDWSQTACDRLEEFFLGGGGVVAEWNGLTSLFTSIAPGTETPMTPICGLSAGEVSEGGFLPLDVITLDSSSRLVEGLSSPFSLGSGSEFFYEITNIQQQWSIAATYVGRSGHSLPALLETGIGTGCVVVGVFDFFDALVSGHPYFDEGQTLVANMIAAATDCAGISAVFADDFESGSLGAWNPSPGQ